MVTPQGLHLVSMMPIVYLTPRQPLKRSFNCYNLVDVAVPGPPTRGTRDEVITENENLTWKSDLRYENEVESTRMQRHFTPTARGGGDHLFVPLSDYRERGCGWGGLPVSPCVCVLESTRPVRSCHSARRCRCPYPAQVSKWEKHQEALGHVTSPLHLSRISIYVIGTPDLLSL
ncbi:hypothetical protein J6590_002528 [Homalodisca vitripennis]|nr:hypothetical protein J6590_002528 [Homalodisca vitripennis]